MQPHWGQRTNRMQLYNVRCAAKIQKLVMAKVRIKKGLYLDLRITETTGLKEKALMKVMDSMMKARSQLLGPLFL